MLTYLYLVLVLRIVHNDLKIISIKTHFQTLQTIHKQTYNATGFSLGALNLRFLARFNLPTQLKRFYFLKNPFAYDFVQPVAYATKNSPSSLKNDTEFAKTHIEKYLQDRVLKTLYFEYN